MGDLDSHQKNLGVMPGGTAYSFDFGHRIVDLEKSFAYARKLAAEALWDLGRQKDSDYEQHKEFIGEDLKEKMDELALRIDFSRVNERISQRSEIPENPIEVSYLGKRLENAKRAASGDWSPEDAPEVGLMAVSMNVGDLLVSRSGYNFSQILDSSEEKYANPAQMNKLKISDQNSLSGFADPGFSCNLLDEFEYQDEWFDSSENGRIDDIFSLDKYTNEDYKVKSLGKMLEPKV